MYIQFLVFVTPLVVHFTNETIIAVVLSRPFTLKLLI